MTTYTITQTQLDLLLGVLDRAGTTDDGEYKWDTHSKATKMLQSLTPNGEEAEAAPSTSLTNEQIDRIVFEETGLRTGDTRGVNIIYIRRIVKAAHKIQGNA